MLAACNETLATPFESVEAVPDAGENTAIGALFPGAVSENCTSALAIGW